MKEKLWTPRYIFALLLVFAVNMGYTLLNSVMAIYGKILSSSEVMGGLLISVFTLSALVARLFISKLNTRFSNKAILSAGLAITLIATVGYCTVKDISLFLICRGLHGVGFGLGLTCATAICNEYVPSSRLAEGVGFTSSANTLASAIGPTIALQILGEKYTGFLSLFLLLLGISVVAFVCSFLNHS